jgi:hypothetical protein
MSRPEYIGTGLIHAEEVRRARRPGVTVENGTPYRHGGRRGVLASCPPAREGAGQGVPVPAPLYTWRTL